ncbi:DinB family protein [soil metagenome]
MADKRTNSDSRVELLLRNLDCAFDKPGWQGPNLAGSVRGVNSKLAVKSISGRMSIWQQVLHAAYWKQRVINLLVGTQPFPRKGSNWPELPEVRSEKNWKADVQLLHDIHKNLRAAVVEIDPNKLTDKITRLILGAAGHDLYHTGQIRLLRRMLGLARKS